MGRRRHRMRTQLRGQRRDLAATDGAGGRDPLADLQGAIDGVMRRMQEVSATTPTRFICWRPCRHWSTSCATAGARHRYQRPVQHTRRPGHARLHCPACRRARPGRRSGGGAHADAGRRRLRHPPGATGRLPGKLVRSAGTGGLVRRHARTAGRRCTRALNEQGHWSMERTVRELALLPHALPLLSSAHWLEGFCMAAALY